MNPSKDDGSNNVTDFAGGRIIPLKKIPQADSASVVDILKKELASATAVVACEDRIVVLVRNADYERLGTLLQRLQQIIDQYCPDRQAHLSVVVRNGDKQQENVFKIWKPV